MRDPDVGQALFEHNGPRRSLDKVYKVDVSIAHFPHLPPGQANRVTPDYAED